MHFKVEIDLLSLQLFNFIIINLGPKSKFDYFESHWKKSIAMLYFERYFKKQQKCSTEEDQFMMC